MTADWLKIPYDILDKISRRIVNEVRHVNRVVYDITLSLRLASSGNNFERSQKPVFMRVCGVREVF